MKSIFTKLSTLLLCGAVAMVGCTDFSEDIQAVDTKVDGLTTELNNYKASTAATIAELEASIAALEAKQEQMAADYAKKSELEAAKTELQDKLSAEIAKVNASISDAVDAIAALEAGKADKTEVADLKKTVEDAIAEANAAIAALDAAKADKTQVNEIDGKVATLIEGYQQMIQQFQNLSLIVDGKAEQADLELVEKDVESLKQGYMETVQALQNIMGILSTKADQADLELAEKDIESLKTAAAEAVFAITNLNASVDALDARVEALESEMKKVQSEIALHTEALQNLAGRLEAAEGAIEDEAALRKKADEALQNAVALLEMGLTNLQVAYNVHIEEFEAHKDAVAKRLEELELQDALIYKTIESIKNDLYNAIDATAETLRAERDEALAALEKKIVEAWELERALIYKTIADIQNTLFNAIEAGDAAVIEKMELADALIYKTIDSYRGILEIAILEGDAAVTEAMEAADALIYNTIADIQNTLFIAIEEGDAAVLETVAAQLEEELALVYNTVDSIKNDLYNAIEYGDAEVAKAAQDALDEAVALIYKTIDNTRENLQKEIAQLNKDLLAYVDGHVADIYKTILSQKADLQAEIEELRNELKALVETVSMDVEALLARVQSLVYVPDYSDHKATIEWAMIASTNVMPAAAENDVPAYSIVTKATDLKYLVKANAGEDAASVASQIAANASVLDYLVTDVKTRGASQSGADLEIVNVKAEGEYIIVSVVAKKFDAKFFENKRQGIYSAALALADSKGNNLTSEYTNLVPGEAAHIEMGLYLTEADDVMNVAGTEETTKMPCNDSETVYTSLTPAIGFIIDDEKAMANLTSVQPYLTVEDLKALGYDMDVKYRLNLANAMDLNIPGYSMSNNTINKYFITGNDAAGNVTVSVKENTPFTEKGKSIFAKYTATANGTTVTYVHYFVLSNAQVAVNMETNVDWTVALYSQLYDSKAYAKSYVVDSVAFEAVGGPVVNLKPVLNSPAVPAEGSPKFYVKNAGEWVEATDRSFKLAKFHNGSADIELIGGTYSWNNSYKIVWETVNDDENVDYTTTAIVNLVGRPDEIVVPVDAVYTLNGKESYFRADVDLFGESFKKVQPYLGYETAAADTAKWKAIFSGNFLPQLESNLPVVNGKPGRTSTLYNLEQARLSILEHNNGRYTINVDQPNVIEWTGTPYFGVPVNFTITGDVKVPATAENFIYSQDYVKDINGRPYAEVFGKIEEVEGDKEVGASKKYSIIKSDLAKYFNLDIESLEGHNYTVDFEVTLPDAESEIGNVKVLPNTTTPVVTDKGAATYYYFLQDQAVLDWDTYRGLEVIVSATLKVNGFTVDSKKLALITKDPLTLTGADFSVTRKLRDNTDIPVYKSLVLTSSVEEFANLLTTDKKAVNKTESNVAADLAKAEAYANQVYGADIEVVLGPKGVYYYDNTGKLIILGTNKYGYDGQTGILTIYGDDANVKNYYADFTAVMSSVICGGEHKVPFRVTATVAK